MPYIKDDGRREDLNPGHMDRPDEANDAGELNFQITMVCSNFLDKHGLNYANINTAIGALECAKLELYSRIARPYEDKKIRENGDVYPHSLTGE